MVSNICFLGNVGAVSPRLSAFIFSILVFSVCHSLITSGGSPVTNHYSLITNLSVWLPWGVTTVTK